MGSYGSPLCELDPKAANVLSYSKKLALMAKTLPLFFFFAEMISDLGVAEVIVRGNSHWVWRLYFVARNK